MNYLAHLFLAGNDPDSAVGHLAADFVRAGDIASYPEPVQRGIRLHQRVDAFCDSHRIVGRSKGRMEPPYRRYAGILVDVFYDHFLAKCWGEYCPDMTLEEFAQRSYDLLRSREPELPTGLRRILPYMIQADWLTSYRRTDAIDRTLKGIARRLRSENPLPTAISVLENNYAALAGDFRIFFPEMIRFVGHMKRELPPAYGANPGGDAAPDKGAIENPAGNVQHRR